MLLKSYLINSTGQQLIGLGMTCMSFGAFLVIGGLGWIDLPDFIVGLFYGLAGVLAGLSIVFNLRGLIKIREEQNQ